MFKGVENLFFIQKYPAVFKQRVTINITKK